MIHSLHVVLLTLKLASLEGLMLYGFSPRREASGRFFTGMNSTTILQNQAHHYHNAQKRTLEYRL
jgi:hypothetical protein